MRTLLVVLLLAGLSTAHAQNSGLSGRRAPSFSLPDYTTKQHDILDYRGKWLILNFSQTDLPRSQEVAKKLEPVKAKFGTKVEILTIVLTPPENQQTAAKFMNLTKSTSPVLFDQGQVAVTYFKATPQNNKIDMPHVFAINPAGNIVKDWTLAGQDGTFFTDLDNLLAGSASKTSPDKK